MTLEKLHDLLDPHFTETEIQDLIEFAHEGYEDANGCGYDDDEELLYEFVRNYLLDCSEDDVDDFNSYVVFIINRNLTREEYDRLLDDMDERWMEIE